MLFPIILYFLLQVLIQRLLLPFLSLHFLFHHPGLFSVAALTTESFLFFIAHLLLKHQLVAVGVREGVVGESWGLFPLVAEFCLLT